MQSRAAIAAKNALIRGSVQVVSDSDSSRIIHRFKRATQVRTAVMAAGGKALDQRLLVAKGYGPLVPLACNDTAEGQRVNRRVEVWIRD